MSEWWIKEQASVLRFRSFGRLRKLIVMMIEAVVGVESTHSSDSYWVSFIITAAQKTKTVCRRFDITSLWLFTESDGALRLFISLSPVFFSRLGQPEFKGPHPPQHLAPLSWSQPALAAHLRPALHPRLWDRRGHRLRWVRSTHPAKPLSYLDCASWISVSCMLWKLVETLYWPLKVCIGVLWHSIIYDSEILSCSAEFWS